MSHTQFSMVEELAFLVKDNLPCKHLVLSMEDMLVDFLQNETSLDEVLELEPMNPYNRLLLHRLADIFGFSHQSIGEGDERRLILKRCEDTSIPSILVADMLSEHDDYQQSPVTSHLLSRREDGSAGTKVETLSSQVSLEDREAAYLAARKRIFSTEDDDMETLGRERPRHNPVVARRMIAHALGQRIKQCNQEIRVKDAIGYQEPTNQVQEKGQNVSPSLESRAKSKGQQHLNKKVPLKVDIEGSTNVTVSRAKQCDTRVPKHNLKEEPTNQVQEKGQNVSPSLESRAKSNGQQHLNKKVPLKVDIEGSTNVTVSRAKQCDTRVPKHNLKEEHVGAAKRMFANALRMHPVKDSVLSKCGQTKQTDKS